MRLIPPDDVPCIDRGTRCCCCDSGLTGSSLARNESRAALSNETEQLAVSTGEADGCSKFGNTAKLSDIKIARQASGMGSVLNLSD